jgi:hypothetical protein
MIFYRNCTWDLIENVFLSFKIHDIPRLHNQQADSLAKYVATFIPPIVLKLKYHIDMRHKPSIPKNLHYWKFFKDDEQIKQFMEMVDEFSETHIDRENQNDPFCIMQEGENPDKFKDMIANHKILWLKNNQIPKGIILLEILFDQNDIHLKSTLQPQPEEVEYCNVGSNENAKLVKLSKYLPTELKRKYIELLKKYKYVFSWS